MRKIVSVISIILLSYYIVPAQNDMDAFRFSQICREGTARFMGTGGSLGAVGADFSAISVNPAAIAIFKKYEISFTPLAISSIGTQSSYNNSSSAFMKLQYTLPNAGMVLKIPLSDEQWNGLYFGFGYNRIQDYNGGFKIEGRSNGSSMAEALARNAEGVDFYNQSNPKNGDMAWWAWESYLIDPVSNWSSSNVKYVSAISGLNLLQSRSIVTTGKIDEMSFTAGANYNDKIYFGGSVGIPFIRYTEHVIYKEEDDKNEDPILKDFKIEDKLDVKATGINLKLGFIYQPLDFMRIGLGFTTPTYYARVADHFKRDMLSNYTINDTNRWETASYENDFNYTLTTPLRATASVAFLINKRGFINLEYEITDYSQASMMSVDYNFSAEKEAISKKYGVSHAARIGGEVNVSQNFLLRAGYNFISSPYKKDVNTAHLHIISAGIGFRFSYVFFDIAYACQLSKEKYWMYDPDLVNPATNRHNKHRVYATIGVKF